MPPVSVGSGRPHPKVRLAADLVARWHNARILVVDPGQKNFCFGRQYAISVGIVLDLCVASTPGRCATNWRRARASDASGVLWFPDGGFLPRIDYSQRALAHPVDGGITSISFALRTT